MLSTQRTGELAAGGAALVWSFFPVVTVITVSALPPLTTAAIGTAFATLFFAVVVTTRKHWAELRIRAAWKDMLLATLFIGIIFYALVFTGYSLTTPGNGAVVSLMEIFFAFVILNLLWRHERFEPLHAIGGVMMGLGALIILIPKQTGGWNIGDLLIVLASAFAPIGNIYAQRARKLVSSDTVMFVRSCVSALFLLGLALIFEGGLQPSAIGQSFWLLAFNGIVLLGASKILWMEAIHRLPISKTVALTAIEVLLALILAYLLLGQIPTRDQLLSILPMFLGVFLLTRK